MKNDAVNWCYETDPEPEMHHRRIEWPRGKVLGGSSAINGMIYIRGQAADYDSWAEMGNEGWSYDDVLPYFKLAEHNVNGANEWHGVGGPLWVDNVPSKFDLADLYLQAAHDVGHKITDDFNAPDNEGFGYYQNNIRDGKRQSTAATYLKLAKSRPNLDIVTGGLAEEILLDGDTATGIRYSLKQKKKSDSVVAKARKEVILCGGAVNSPQLLELSGIGNPDVLQKAGVEVKHALPGVGENLHDHLSFNVIQGLEGVNTFFEETRPAAFLKNLYKYFVKHDGLLVHPACQVGGFFKTSEQSERADAQIHFAPAAGQYNAKGNIETVPGTTAAVCYLRPTSRGWVHIKSDKADQHPSIRANYLATEHDRDAMVAAVHKVREIFQAPAFDASRRDELEPGPQVQTDEEILDAIRDSAISVYHPVGSCKMGNDDMAVVDNKLQVQGLKNLRVADASIMPSILSGNTNAACVMIADRCADFILNKQD
jgi:choline dehydrogenase